jgi:membrane protein implicated in regulation of membrane protease activity
MSRRKRKLIGTILLIGIVPAYAMLAVELSRYVLAGASWWVQAVFFLVAGMAWAIPVLPLIRWMERLSPEEQARQGTVRR